MAIDRNQSPCDVRVIITQDCHSALNDHLKKFFIYHVSTLLEAGYTVEYDGTDVIISKWDPEWRLTDRYGRARKYGKDHVSVFHEQDYWQRWFQAEQAVGGDGATTYSQAFYVLAADYQEG